jgi:ribosomal protein S18 acetylase RimI-like enzyme
MPVRIRPAETADALEIARVEVESWRWAYPGLVPASYLDGLSVARCARGWAQLLGAKGTRTVTWVASSDERGCCGFLSAGPSRAERAAVGELYSLYVSPQLAGTGVGHRLLAYTTAQLKAMMFGSAELWVLEKNERARRFYEREGWTLTGAPRREPIARTSVSVVRYERAL